MIQVLTVLGIHKGNLSIDAVSLVRDTLSRLNMCAIHYLKCQHSDVCLFLHPQPNRHWNYDSSRLGAKTVVAEIQITRNRVSSPWAQGRSWNKVSGPTFV